MIDWAGIKATAQGMIADLSGAVVRWQDESAGTEWDADPIIYLRISAIGDLGIPEESTDPPTSNEDQTVVVASQKRFTLSLRAESFDQDIASDRHAGALVETLRTRLFRSSAIERRRGVFAILDDRGAAYFSYTDQEREVSAYTLDLLCATVDNDVDTTVGAGGYIAEVRLRSEYLRGPDGAQTPTQVSEDIT